MASLREYAAGIGDVLHPHGELDLLLYYGLIAEKMQTYLQGRELATRTWLPEGRIRAVVKRGSFNPPFYVRQMAGAVTPAMMEARAKLRTLEAAKHVLSADQALTWFYFAPRRYIGFHYATNREGAGREISRVVYDVDRGRGVSAEDAIGVAARLVQSIAGDDRAADFARGEPFVYWTGRSFHVTLSLKALQPASFYEEQIECTGKGRTLTDRLVAQVAGSSKVPVAAGYERCPGYVTIDPSPTPSGHLCSVPIGSLYMDSASAIGGVSVPLTMDMLRRDVVSDLLAYSPQRVIDELDDLAWRLPG